MHTTRSDVTVGLALAGLVAAVFMTAMRAGMSSTGLHGSIEIAASFLFLLTLPVGGLAVVCGRLAMSYGFETAFAVTGITWSVLSVPYGAIVARGCRTLAVTHRTNVQPADHTGGRDLIDGQA
ncbi:MAG: hypothetical protein Q8K82_26675 [Gemmatimonadaceae bacterium]|nr:hypothetical protein [Gemmatimonadaceae bacterium]